MCIWPTFFWYLKVVPFKLWPVGREVVCYRRCVAATLDRFKMFSFTLLFFGHFNLSKNNKQASVIKRKRGKACCKKFHLCPLIEMLAVRNGFFSSSHFYFFSSTFNKSVVRTRIQGFYGEVGKDAWRNKNIKCTVKEVRSSVLYLVLDKSQC